MGKDTKVNRTDDFKFQGLTSLVFPKEKETTKHTKGAKMNNLFRTFRGFRGFRSYKLFVNICVYLWALIKSMT